MRRLFREVPVLLLCLAGSVIPASPPQSGLAAWYGEEHRGRLMANGQPFDPEQLTAASWFYPLGTKIRVTAAGSTNSVEVVITDRGPARQYLHRGRILDLSREAFERLGSCDLGVIEVRVDAK